MSEKKKDHKVGAGSTEKKPDSKLIENAEKKLGIKTQADRLKEASLFIDHKFVKVAVISGQTEGLERLFGQEQWLGWLNARSLAREQIAQPLTRDFIIEISRAIQQKDWAWVRKEDVHGGSGEKDHPITLNSYQFQQVRDNFANKDSYTQFTQLEWTQEGHRGYFTYPSGDTPETTEAIILGLLDEVCEWYNAQKQQPHNTVLLAAQLEQKIASIHPFLDGNGRVARLLMDWSLESEKQSPAILEDFDSDHFLSPQNFAREIDVGLARFHSFTDSQQELEKLGIENPALLFGLDDEATFYRYIYQLMQQAPSLKPDSWGEIDHEQVEAFLLAFAKEKEQFESKMTRKSHNEIRGATGGVIKINTTQGGFIPLGLMDFYGRNDPKDMEYILSHYFHDEPIYRGGFVDKPMSEEQLISMFVDFSNVESSYRAVERAGAISTNVFKKMYPRTIVDSQDYYNKLVSMYYLLGYYPEIYNANRTVFKDCPKRIDELIPTHVSGYARNIWESPFVSYAAIRDSALPWLTQPQVDDLGTRGSQLGILVKSALPKHGLVQTFGDETGKLPFSRTDYDFENELLIAGAVIPFAAETIATYETKSGDDYGRMLLRARKIFSLGDMYVEVSDYDENNPKQRLYLYDPANKSFTRISEQDISLPPRAELYLRTK